jgi:membrane-associated phospholipid phosphatase
VLSRALLSGAALVFASLFCAADGRAEPPPAEGDHRLVWDYPRFRPWQYAATLGVSLTGAYVERASDDYSPKTHWGPILFDEPVRTALVSTNFETRQRLAKISNLTWNLTQYYPIIVDSLFIPLVTDKFNYDVAAQMLLIDWQVQSYAFFLLRIGHRAIGRERPSLQECASDPNYDTVCHDADSAHASFFSGHSLMAFTGAALTCTHHAHLALYDSDFLGGLACAVTMTSASVTAVMRIISDNHWTTDVLTGVGLGLAMGFGMPYLLHYGPHLRVKQGKHPVDLAIMPIVATDATGISLVGMQ